MVEDHGSRIKNTTLIQTVHLTILRYPFLTRPLQNITALIFTSALPCSILEASKYKFWCIRVGVLFKYILGNIFVQSSQVWGKLKYPVVHSPVYYLRDWFIFHCFGPITKLHSSQYIIHYIFTVAIFSGRSFSPMRLTTHRMRVCPPANLHTPPAQSKFCTPSGFIYCATFLGRNCRALPCSSVTPVYERSWRKAPKDNERLTYSRAGQGTGSPADTLTKRGREFLVFLSSLSFCNKVIEVLLVPLQAQF